METMQERILGILTIDEPAPCCGGYCGRQKIRLIIMEGEDSLENKMTRLYADTIENLLFDDEIQTVKEKTSENVQNILEGETVEIGEIIFYWQGGDETVLVHSTDDK